MHEISVNQDYVQVAPDHSGAGMGIRGFRSRGDHGGTGDQHLRAEACRLMCERIEQMQEQLDEMRLLVMQIAGE